MRPRRRGGAWVIVLALGVFAQAVNKVTNPSNAVDYVEVGIGLATLILVIWIFWYEQRASYSPLKLIGAMLGAFPPVDDHRKVSRIEISSANPTFTLVVRPNIGGPCTEFEREFQRPAPRWRRPLPRDWMHPVAHYVSPDVIQAKNVRIFSNGRKEEKATPITHPPERFAIDPPLVLTPDEPLHCEVTAAIHKAWEGEFSIRFKVQGVARGTVRIHVRATP